MFHGGSWWSYVRYDEEQDRPQVDRILLRRVLSYGRPYQGKLTLVLVTIVIISLVSVVPPLLMRRLLDVAIPEEDLGMVTLLGIGMVAVPVMNGIIGVLQRWATAAVGEGIIYDLRRQLFGHLQRMSVGFFTGTRTGELMSRLNNDVVGAQQAVTGTFVNLASNSVSTVLTLAVMLTLEWRLTLIAVAVLPVFILMSRRVGKLLRVVRREQMEHNARMNSLMQEVLSVSGALLAKLFGRIPDEDSRFAERAADVRDTGVRQALIGRWFFMALGIASAVGTALVFWFGAWMVINGDITIGTIVALSAYLTALYGPLSALSNARVEFSTSLVSFERVFEVIDLPRDIEERADAHDLDEVVGSLEFDDVSFSYGAGSSGGLSQVKRYSSRTPTELQGLETPQPSTREWALQDISFAVEPGELVALVGPSGAGKTTTTYLVPRLYDVTEGAIRIDGHDVRDVTSQSLASAIGVVTQESYLFHDSIAANLRYAKPTASLDELRAAARVANIDDFISALPGGYETVVGERGYRLSGGEKQRVAIARVVLKDPEILILDEATSHLDAQNEALIQEALERVMEGRTSLVIAHRLSTILAADRILVVEGGRLVDTGTHQELVARGGLYADLYETQFRNLGDPVAG
ncbi:MAG: ABC transporter ATP-binding protein [Acidimicrobiia bacterium]|nr:ABC transporter ATP-binding protein [Acidimicrobiia bacterium]